MPKGKTKKEQTTIITKPMPTPHSDEDESSFMERCMGNDEMMDEFPDEEQRGAVCMRQWEEHEEMMDEDKSLKSLQQDMWGSTVVKGFPVQATRWNPTLSKAFDAQNEPLRPQKLEYAWVSKFLQCPVREIHMSTDFAGGVRMGSFLTALRHVTGVQHQTAAIRNISYDGTEEPPLYEHIQLNSKQSDDFLVEGIIFFKGDPDFVLKIQPSWGGVHLTCYVHQARKSFTASLFSRTWELSKEYKFLKGEAFSLAGQFLKRGSTSFDDLFLDKKNERPIKMALKLVNEKGKSVANRGMIFMGPPGTGKTLSGRILLNQANATFIWISSRDFYYMGAFGGLAHAFDLARELAPTILFIEDIDNWLSPHSTDLLKTEMDGVSQSTGVVTILTTNYPELLPEALIDRPGRFHDVLRFGLPDADIRRKMLKKWLPELSDKDSRSIAAKTEGYSGAHVYELCHFAKTIQEQEEKSVEDAIVAALEKIEEQRELITEAQLSGSRYRPRKSVLEGLKKYLPDDLSCFGLKKAIHASDVIKTLSERGYQPVQKDGRLVQPIIMRPKLAKPENENGLDAFTPTEAEVAMINQHTLRDFAREELWTVTMQLADNAIDRQFDRFTPKALHSLAKSYKKGRPQIFNHVPDAQGVELTMVPQVTTQ